MAAYKYDVKDGPAAAELVHAFLYAYDSRHPFWVEFFVVPEGMRNSGISWQPVKRQARVTGVSYESATPGLFMVQLLIKEGTREVPASGFYDATRRKGHLVIGI